MCTQCHAITKHFFRYNLLANRKVMGLVQKQFTLKWATHLRAWVRTLWLMCRCAPASFSFPTKPDSLPDLVTDPDSYAIYESPNLGVVKSLNLTSPSNFRLIWICGPCAWKHPNHRPWDFSMVFSCRGLKNQVFTRCNCQDFIPGMHGPRSSIEYWPK